MKTVLEDFGFECDIASNGNIAIEKLQNKSYDIILMDLQMPQMNGFEATEYIRNKMHLNIPIIALTADVTPVDVAKCKSVGMNDYIAKPLDERLLYSKLISLVKKPVLSRTNGYITVKNEEIIKTKYTDLGLLNKRTKSNPKLMREMIKLYLEQTPTLINSMNQSLEAKDWKSLKAVIHKMIPSFSIVGISKDYEEIAKNIQEYAGAEVQTERIPDMLYQLDKVCTQACRELEEELESITN